MECREMADSDILRLRNQLFSIRMSIRYHRARQSFFDGWANKFRFVSALSSTAVVASVLASGPSWLTVGAGLLVAVSQIIDLVGSPSQKARLHDTLAQEFIFLEEKVTAFVGKENQVDADVVQEIVSERLKIESKEPPALTWLVLRSRNEQITTYQGLGSPDIVKIPWLQRIFIQVADLYSYKSDSGSPA